MDLTLSLLGGSKISNEHQILIAKMLKNVRQRVKRIGFQIMEVNGLKPRVHSLKYRMYVSVARSSKKEASLLSLRIFTHEMIYQLTLLSIYEGLRKVGDRLKLLQRCWKPWRFCEQIIRYWYEICSDFPNAQERASFVVLRGLTARFSFCTSLAQSPMVLSIWYQSICPRKFLSKSGNARAETLSK